MLKEDITEEMITDIMEGNEDARIRGPHIRATLESIVIAYENPDKQDRKYLIQFIESLIALMPCDECSGHFQQYVRENPIPWTRKELLDWLITAHDNVNERNGKDRLGFMEGLKDISLRINAKTIELEENQVSM